MEQWWVGGMRLLLGRWLGAAVGAKDGGDYYDLGTHLEWSVGRRWHRRLDHPQRTVKGWVSGAVRAQPHVGGDRFRVESLGMDVGGKVGSKKNLGQEGGKPMQVYK